MVLLYSVVGKWEFCSENTAFTLNATNLVDKVFTPGYPDSYSIDEHCKIAITVDLDGPFTVTMVSEVEDCSTHPYAVYLETFRSTPIRQPSTCFLSSGSNQLTTTVTYTGNEYYGEIDKIALFLLQGSGNGFSISVSG